jgi:hypothetical protein
VRKNYTFFVVGGFFVMFGLAMQIFVAQLVEIMSLRRELRIAQQACHIETQQSEDLAQQLSQLKAENLAIGTRQYIAGVIDTFSRPEKYSAIWHNGYDRGMATQQYADQLMGSSEYTTITSEK